MADKRRTVQADYHGTETVTHDACDRPPPRFHPIGSLVIRAFERCGVVPPQTAVTVTSARLTANLVASGRFLGVLASLSNRHAPIKMLPIELPSTEWPASAVMLKNRTLGPTAKLFLETVREVVEAGPLLAGRRSANDVVDGSSTGT